ncbi:SDR family oxidoreductase [Streptomyces sp. NPDC048565]|uniref:SDR family NAD(P)-dependent oxidoreductase n=1 Tax=Streptomyces sp. NPDC048565 TaxID=3155266 RepID=UPI003420D1FB
MVVEAFGAGAGAGAGAVVADVVGALTCDVTSEEDVQRAVGRTVEQFGRLDAAFNNAGVEQPVKPLVDLTKTDWDRVLGVSLTGVFLCARAQVRQMRRQGDGGGQTV